MKLLSGGNPQIAKGDGDAPVQAYIAAMPGWKRDLGTASTRSSSAPCPTCARPSRWNSPFYGVEGDGWQGWFLSFHVFTRYVKVTSSTRSGKRSTRPSSGHRHSIEMFSPSM